MMKEYNVNDLLLYTSSTISDLIDNENKSKKFRRSKVKGEKNAKPVIVILLTLFRILIEIHKSLNKDNQFKEKVFIDFDEIRNEIATLFKPIEINNSESLTNNTK